MDVSGKYLYTIRSANGVIVKNLRIYGKSRTDADEKIHQMYRRCEILHCELSDQIKSRRTNYEDVLDAIITSNA